MKICDKTIIFKSTPDNWIKEKSGVKANTVRYLDAYEWDEVKDRKIQNIQIVNTETHQTFTREISDITIANIKKVPVWVFSWLPDVQV